MVIHRSSLVQIYTLSCVLFWGFWNKRSLKKWFFPPLTRPYQVNDLKNNRPQSESIKICINRQSTCITGFCCCFFFLFHWIVQSCRIFIGAHFCLQYSIIILWWMLHFSSLQWHVFDIKAQCCKHLHYCVCIHIIWYLLCFCC